MEDTAQIVARCLTLVLLSLWQPIIISECFKRESIQSTFDTSELMVSDIEFTYYNGFYA